MTQLRGKGLGLAAISYDSTEILGTFSQQHGITFPLLSDPGSATIKAYGILATVAEEALDRGLDDPVLAADVRLHVTQNAVNERVRGVPYPGTFMVDRQGRVTARFFEDFFRERNTVSSMMLKLGTGRPSVEGTQASTDHLDLKTYPSDAAVALGNRFSLVVDITPHKGMHVYAPGAAGYRVIALKIAPQSFVRVLPAQYPASEIYVFKPLNERVEVFQKPFRLVQEVALSASPDARKALAFVKTLSITGALEYQACDDKVCFLSKSVPVTYTVRVRELDTERATVPKPE